MPGTSQDTDRNGRNRNSSSTNANPAGLASFDNTFMVRPLS
jgi:hypothetical protein